VPPSRSDEQPTALTTAELERIYRDLYPQLVRLGRLLGHPNHAEDLAQSAFMSLARSPALRNPDAVAAFLRRCVVNQTRTDHRRYVLWRKLMPRLVDERPAPAPDDVQRLVVRRAMHRLSRRQREVLVLRYVADFSVAETAELLGIAEGTVKATAHDGLQKLAARLEAEGIR
jgi:RNA polymerase sigma factor (sigma-70 family)